VIDEKTVTREGLMSHFPVHFDTEEEVLDREAVSAKIVAAFRQKLQVQQSLIQTLRPDLAKMENLLWEVLRNLMVRNIDRLWQEHLLGIDHLRSDIQMRTVGQKDPLLEFKHESFGLFERFFDRLRKEIIHDLFRFEMVPPPQKTAILPFAPPKTSSRKA
jgi:preprotein translocase subunit SecA